MIVVDSVFFGVLEQVYFCFFLPYAHVDAVLDISAFYWAFLMICGDFGNFIE